MSAGGVARAAALVLGCGASLRAQQTLPIPPRAEASDAQRLAAMDPLSRMLLEPRLFEVEEERYAALRSETVAFENGNGLALRGLWYESDASDRTVLVCMGNTGNCSWFVPFAEILHGGGFDVLLFDYQGFGRSEGVANLLSLPGDALAAWRFVAEVKGRAPAQVGLLGISLGSVLALQLAAAVQPAACAVEDVFFPDEELAAKVGAPDSAAARLALAALKGLVLPQVDPRANARRFAGPLFLLHGDLDWLLTPMATLRLLEQRPERTRAWILAGTGHSPDSLQIDEWEYRDQLRRFFADAFGGELAPEPRARFEVAGEAPLRLRVTLESPREEPVQIAFVRPREGHAALDAFYERRYAVAGALEFEIEAPFLPAHAVATGMTHALPRGDGTFERELSPLSEQLADYAALEEEWGRQPRDVTVKGRLAQGEARIELALRGERQWAWLRPRLPDPADLDPRVRPRYAELLAWLAFDLRASACVGSGPALEEACAAMARFLPPDPLRFVTLGNARITVGMPASLYVPALAGLWQRRLLDGDVGGAREIERTIARFVPELAAPGR